MRALCAALKVNATVEYVSVIGNQIGDGGADALIDALPRLSIKQMDAQDNLISPGKKVALTETALKRGIKLTT
jgi:hypothetical protein